MIIKTVDINVAKVGDWILVEGWCEKVVAVFGEEIISSRENSLRISEEIN